MKNFCHNSSHIQSVATSKIIFAPEEGEKVMLAAVAYADVVLKLKSQHEDVYVSL